MAPSVQSQEIVGVWRVVEPVVGDVVAFVPQGESAPSFKRVVAVGPASVSLSERGGLTVDGALLDGGESVWMQLSAPGCEGGEHELQTLTLGERSVPVVYGGTAVQEVEIPDGSYYLLGDNRPGSSDSRHLGPISSDRILGVATRVLWSSDSCNGNMRWDRIATPLR
jgi:signal peptidase I